MKSFKEYRFDRNPKEKKLVYTFIKEHSHGQDMDLIVFGHRSESFIPNDYLSDREKQIVLSTIQWLGSPVGEGFLERCGYESGKYIQPYSFETLEAMECVEKKDKLSLQELLALRAHCIQFIKISHPQSSTELEYSRMADEIDRILINLEI